MYILTQVYLQPEDEKKIDYATYTLRLYVGLQNIKTIVSSQS